MVFFFYSRTEKAARAKESFLPFGRVAFEEDEVSESNFETIVSKLCKPREKPNLFEFFRGAAYLRNCVAGSMLRLSERNTKFI